jgi:hypothetical protein
MSEPDKDLDAELTELAGQFFYDPLGWTLAAFPWGQGELARWERPDDWQCEHLEDFGRELRKRKFDGHTAVTPTRMAVSSGHGIGKTADVSFVALFIMSTRPFAKGIVTANSSPQLETKTWAELARWKKRCLWGPWFRMVSGRGAMKLFHRDHPETWKLTAMAWREHMPEAFAGQHAADSSSFYLFDEASAVPKPIFETAEGGLTDGEPMMFMWGNPTRNSGYFYEAFHGKRHLWNTRKIDSRTARIPNKEKLQQDIDTHGIDSDYVKVKILGEFPSQSSSQFIPTADVEAAMKRDAFSNATDPIIIGVDVARYGTDESVVRVRQGRNGKTYKPLRFRGIDTMQLAAHVFKLCNELRADVIFVDETGVGGGVVDRLRQLAGDTNVEIIGVNFGGKSPDRTCANMAAYMWMQMRDWLKAGGAIEQHDGLKTDLTVREYYFDGQNRYVLESKDDLRDRGEASPDDADALALTFAYPVGPRSLTKAAQTLRGDNAAHGADYDPYGTER